MPVVLFACVGSRGDVQPYIAAGLALKTAGWRPVLLVHEPFQKMVTSAGLEVAPFPMRGNLVELFATTEAGRAVKQASLFTAMSALKNFYRPVLKQYFEDTLKATEALNVDLLVLTTFPMAAGGLAIPEIVKKKDGRVVYTVIAHTVPFSPTSELAVPLLGAGQTSMFGWINSLNWSVTDKASYNNLYGPMVSEYLGTYGVTKPPKDLISYTANRLTVPPTPVCFIYSPALVPKPKDWTKDEIVTGFLSLPPPASYSPPAALEEFISSSDEPLVYIGLGSALGAFFDTDAERIAMLDKFVEGFNLYSSKPGAKPIRAILQTTTSESGGSLVPKAAPNPAARFYVQREDVRHDWLFPKCALLVTHGGAGSVQTCCLAGKPIIVLPTAKADDKYFWADVLRRKGVGPAGVLAPALTPAKFASLIEDALFGPGAAGYRSKAAELAAQMAKEDGVGEFVKVCRQLVQI
ncbi:hypothetical protein DFJ74DRAFT_684083 [Hyaloraphidium curvatum]|nr:hypothetical protein DFJ74DRAFT_684083 [Hyaloraphidium curvatum]